MLTDWPDDRLGFFNEYINMSTRTKKAYVYIAICANPVLGNLLGLCLGQPAVM